MLTPAGLALLQIQATPEILDLIKYFGPILGAMLYLGIKVIPMVERLVEANAESHPERLHEWRYYLLYLREFAEIGGALPSSFDRLVWDAFGDLLAADAVPV